ncbi:hypothetical protein F3Y22_tig00110505pilonHSYRG00248 [Hibiscus syriacus]|uniref:Glycolipid transfer protein domain-containing protein n=1 Tax=Hibiscus syriacus TaxID=106335 RepID=A0A6A3AD60_HIBSY|nr:hypothetical protein F3Y22_tig00110505pilonHSYRG00248 [Hibiscus syriacus]
METKAEIRSAIEELSMLTKAHPAAAADVAYIPTRPFLHVCTLILQRLEILLESDPTKYSNLIGMLKREESEGNARKGSSCSKAFPWLTRSMDFMVALLQRLVREPEQNMEQAVQESYNVTLKPRHGWISSAAFKVALKLALDNKIFISLLTKKDQNYDNLKEDMQTLISLLVPLLEYIHSILVKIINRCL